MPRLIVVDDEPIITLTLALILRRKGYDVQTANSGKAALELALAGCPDFLLTDVAMPEMTGLELIAQFRRICPHCRLIVFTGVPESLPDEGLPGLTVLLKPINPDELVQSLAAA